MITPVCFHNFFTLNSSMHHYKTRQSACGDFYLVRKNTVQYGVKCIKYMGATFLNNLPVELRNFTSKFLFKKRLKSIYYHVFSKKTMKTLTGTKYMNRLAQQLGGGLSSR